MWPVDAVIGENGAFYYWHDPVERKLQCRHLLDTVARQTNTERLAAVRDTILRRAKGGAAVLLSSHMLPLVQELCSRVVIMFRGRKMGDGTVQELAARVELHEADSTLEEIFLRVTGHDRAADEGR